MFISSSSDHIGFQHVVDLILTSVIGFRVLPVTLTPGGIQNGGDRGQRPGHKKHCVPIHLVSISININKFVVYMHIP